MPKTANTAGVKKSARRKSTNNTADAMNALAAAVTQLKAPTHVMGEPMVGIRNISNYTIGVRSPFNDEAEVSLASPRYEADAPLVTIPDPNSCTQISHKWWLQLRRGNLVKKGMIMRDDSVLSAGSVRAPEDESGALPREWEANAILDPYQWIESRDEKGIKEGVAAIGSEESLRRLLTAINQRVEYERRELDIPSTNVNTDIEEEAVRNLPWRYKAVEDAVLDQLEKKFYGKMAD